MTILDNYMFRPLQALFRLSLRELKVLLYNVRARDGEISTFTLPFLFLSLLLRNYYCYNFFIHFFFSKHSHGLIFEAAYTVFTLAASDRGLRGNRATVCVVAETRGGPELKGHVSRIESKNSYIQLSVERRLTLFLKINNL